MLYARCQAGAERPAGSGQLMREAGRNENLYACQRYSLSACVRERVGESLGGIVLSAQEGHFARDFRTERRLVKLPPFHESTVPAGTNQGEDVNWF